jgi:hypothetical protein
LHLRLVQGVVLGVSSAIKGSTGRKGRAFVASKVVDDARPSSLPQNEGGGVALSGVEGTPVRRVPSTTWESLERLEHGKGRGGRRDAPMWKGRNRGKGDGGKKGRWCLSSELCRDESSAEEREKVTENGGSSGSLVGQKPQHRDEDCFLPPKERRQKKTACAGRREKRRTTLKDELESREGETCVET